MKQNVIWRGEEYEFESTQIYGGKDKVTKFSNIDAPIFGVDTESVELEGRYEPQCFTLSDPKEDHLYYIPPKEYGLEYLLSWTARNYGDWLMDERVSFFFLHNLAYDFPQLAKTDPRLVEMIKIGVGLDKEYSLFSSGSWKFSLDKNALFVGSAPHFTIKAYHGRDSFDIMFRDTFSYFPGSLDKIAESLNLPIKKMKRQTDLGLRDYRIEPMSEDKHDFEEYAKIDSWITRNAGESIREMHIDSKMEKIRPSAPGFAVTSLFQVLNEDEKLITGSWKVEDMQLIFDTYRGGRTGGIFHGEVKDISVYDFHSSYPASMTSLPTFSDTCEYVRLDDLSLSNVMSILEETGNVFLRVSGEETDKKYPSVITTLHGKLTPIYGEFHNIATTGHEVMVGIKSGSLRITEVHECLVVLDLVDDKKNAFKIFAETGYIDKANAKPGSVVYLKEKIKLNSAYGKLIESRHQSLIGAEDFHIFLKYLPGMEKEFGNYYYHKYIDAIEKGLHMEDIFDEILDELCESFDDAARADFQDEMFGNFSISGRIYGKYVIPAAASLITAISRARLCAAMKSFEAIYWDTDSLFVRGKITNLEDRLTYGSSLLCPGVMPLTIGDGLGELDREISRAAGWLAGTKRYYLEGEDDDSEFKLKVAIHGIPAMPLGVPNEDDDKATTLRTRNVFRKEVISMLAEGNNYLYESKPRPLKTKEAKDAERIGMFRSKVYEPQFHLDERLHWERGKKGWDGTVVPYLELMQRKDKTNHDAIRAAKQFFGG